MDESGQPEDILDELACFDPAETVFEGDASPPAAPAADTPDLGSVLDLLSQLERDGGADVSAVLGQVREALAPIAADVRSESAKPAPVAVVPASADEAALDGEFDSVAEVIDGVFAAAAIVSDDAADAAVMGEGAPAVVAPEPEPEPQPEAEVEVEVEVEVVDDTEEVDRILSSLGVEEIPEPPDEHEDERPVSSVTQTQPSPNAWQRAEPVVVTTLTWINWPVTLLPAMLRPAVDWTALTLLFWIPVVWVIAWLA